MDDDLDDCEVMGEMRTNEHCEAGDEDSDDFDQRIIQRRIEMQKAKEDRDDKNEKQSEDGDSGSDWSDSDESDKDKKASKVRNIDKDIQKVTAPKEPEKKSDTLLIKPVEPQNPVRSSISELPKPANELMVNSFKELLHKLCKAEVVKSTADQIYIKSNTLTQTLIISKRNLLNSLEES
mmetsp:Transcript_32988/g.37843  ORF Transcript_32988/g.37843 Transcript_32988/m.37843 type:complete len:179 (+) Transcript_32988:755-1291(+)